MNARTLILFAAAVSFGILAVILAQRYLDAQKQEQVVVDQNRIEITTVVVATRELFFGDRLTADMLKAISWPKDGVPEGAFPSVEEILKNEPVVLRRIAVNEPILPAKISGAEGRATLSTRITETLRAVSVQVNDVVGVAGFVLPGDRVDILVTREVGENTFVTDILLQNIKILGVDQNANDETQQAQVSRVATVEVTPRQAQKLVLGSSVGQLNLALRNFLDVDPTASPTVTMADLSVSEINVSPNAPVAQAPTTETQSRRVRGGRSAANVVVTRGVDSTSYSVDAGGSATLVPVDPNTGVAPRQPAAPAAPGSQSAAPVRPAAAAGGR